MKQIEQLKKELAEKKKLLQEKREVLMKKQQAINEVNEETDQVNALKKANKGVEKEIFRASKFGKIIYGSTDAAKTTGTGIMAIARGAKKAFKKTAKGYKKAEKYLNKNFG